MNTRTQRLQWADDQSEQCLLCPRQCGVNRIAGEIGWCRAGAEAEYFMAYVHCGEEAGLSPSQTIYLSGCNLRCIFCQTAPERQTYPLRPLTADRLRELALGGAREGAGNLNLLGGEPTVHLPALMRLLDRVDCPLPIIWNTNLYCTAQTLEMLMGLPALYLVDLKFGNPVCAQRLAGAADYLEVVPQRLKELLAAEGPGKVLVRHLVLPGHLDCCTRPVLKWLARELPHIRLSLKLDYLVMPRARMDPHLGRFLSQRERRTALELAKGYNLRLIPHSTPETLLHGEPAGVTGGPGQHEPWSGDTEITIALRGEIYIRNPIPSVTRAVLGALLEKR